MEPLPQFNDIVEEAAALIKQAAKANRGQVAVSPEVAALLKSIHATGKDRAPVRGSGDPHANAITRATCFGSIRRPRQYRCRRPC